MRGLCGRDTGCLAQGSGVCGEGGLRRRTDLVTPVRDCRPGAARLARGGREKFCAGVEDEG